jgi:sugar/nucleoside kinase (ribokinase family)
MTKRVLVVGDVNVDLVLQGDVVPRFGQAEQLLDSADLVVGGSASIFSIGLARLGVDTALAGLVGDDGFGRFMREALRADNVNQDALLTHPTHPTGISVILSHPGDRAILTMPGTVPLLTVADARAAVEAQQPAHVHFASYFLQPALAVGLPELLAWLRQRGISTSLDTNWDPSATWLGLDDVVPLVDLLLPNGSELRGIAGALGFSFDSDEDAGREVAKLGPRVVVKAGAEGGWSVGPDGAIERVEASPIDVVDTTGAGDSFDAGYIAAGIHGLTNEAQKLAWAVAAGSLSTMKRGGTAAQPTLSQLRERVDA